MAARPEAAKKVLVYWMDGMVVLLAVMFVMLAVIHWYVGSISLPHLAAVVACQLGFFLLLPILFRRAYDATPDRLSPLLVVAGLFMLGALALLPHQQVPDVPPWMEVGMLYVSLLALYLPLRVIIGVGVVMVVSVTSWYSYLIGHWQPSMLATQSGSVVGLVCAMLLWRWLWWTIRDAHDGKEAKARLAVAEERLRFARDLHDLLGHSLSVITLKSELAAKLATKDEGRAAAEMADVRHLTGEALAEVQHAVDGYQALDLDDELDSVRAALEAAGTRCVVDVRAEGLSPAARTLLAWAVREGGTNVLKHSSAGRCVITIHEGALEMRNDGLRAPPSGAPEGAPQGGPAGASAGHGSGLRGLSERLVAAGGSFSAEPTQTGEFVLRAAVPA